jgi:glycosyltransferase involved in cell wall biosynthesis
MEGIKALIAHGITVEAALPKDGPLSEIFEGMGVRTHVLPYQWWVSDFPQRLKIKIRNFLRNISLARGFARVVRERRIDLAITSTITSPFGAMAAGFAKIPHLWFLQEFGREDHGVDFDFGDKLSHYFMNTLTTRFIANSEAVRTKYAQWFTREKISLINYSIEVPPEADVPDRIEKYGNSLHLIVVGTHLPGKRQEDAIRAVVEAKGRGVHARLTILGHESGAYTLFIKELADQLCASGEVEFLSFTPEPYRLIASADALLVTSRCEAFGRVTVEAMKLGVPVIGSAGGGTPELVLDGFNGLLYRPCDYMDLADKLEYAYHNRPQLEQMGRNARTWARERFTLERYRASLTKIIETALAEYTGPVRPEAR